MKIALPGEVDNAERRVALTPTIVKRLIDLGYEVTFKQGVGEKAGFSDQAYCEAGGLQQSSSADCIKQADIVIKVEPPTKDEVALLGSQQILISFFWPSQHEASMKALADKHVTVIAMDMIPRISRAQKLDVLSSMANIAGYRAVIEASNHFPRFFSGQITAAGKIAPAKVMVVGAGVAGLSAIGSAARMGAIVKAFDTRPEVADQVESMGGEFLYLEFAADDDGKINDGYAKTMSKAFIDAEMALFREQAKEVDIIITTALIPGRPAPKLILADMVELMKEGSVIVDLAAEQGGNCELTEPGQLVIKKGVTIIGYTDMASRMAPQASELYANNIYNLIAEFSAKEKGQLVLDLEDDILAHSTVTHQGNVLYPPKPLSVTAAPKQAPKKQQASTKPSQPKRKKSPYTSLIVLAIIIGGLLALGTVAPKAFLGHLTVFVLSIFVGWQVIWNVTPALHTPLMSVTNAISGIIIIGALLLTASSSWVVVGLSLIAILITMINISGGFLVTQRMLKMFSGSK